MSISPTQNFSKPPEVPASPTLILTFGLSSLNSSAAAWANGNTVLDPSTLMVPDRSLLPPPSSSPPHAAIPMASRPQAEMASMDLREINSRVSFVSVGRRQRPSGHDQVCYRRVASL